MTTEAEWETRNSWEVGGMKTGFWARAVLDPDAVKHRWRPPLDGTWEALCGVKASVPCRFGPWPMTPGPFCERCEHLFFRCPEDGTRAETEGRNMTTNAGRETQ